MSKINDGQAPGKYTLEFKLEAVRLVEGGQAVPVKARILGVPMQTPGNWVRFSVKGQLKGPGTGCAEGHESNVVSAISEKKLRQIIFRRCSGYFPKNEFEL